MADMNTQTGNPALDDTNHPYEYDEVHVLLFGWEDDDLEVESEIEELRRVFEVDYAFNSATHLNIPSENAVLYTMGHLGDCLEHPKNLLIVYYGGHGSIRQSGETNLILSPYRVCTCQKSSGLTVDLGRLQDTMASIGRLSIESDTLTILDSCEAVGSINNVLGYVMPKDPKTTSSRIELITSSGFGGNAPGVGKFSFTRSLIEVLQSKSASREPFSIAHLHFLIVANLLPLWHEHLRLKARGMIQKQPGTPVHMVIQEESDRRGIGLQTFRFRPSGPEERDTLEVRRASGSGV